jgi:prepilin-type N-terminal cleavage/methylation domain-containing protein
MRHRGFTLIELLIVITIIAILAGLSASGAMAVLNASKRNQTELVLAKADAACRMFFLDVRAYPRGASMAPPVRYAADGDILTDPATGLPIPDNDAVWASGTAPWRVGNGLFARLGQAMTKVRQQQAMENAETLRQVEFERFYHIGNIGNLDCTGLSKPPGWRLTTTMRLTGSIPTPTWSYFDPKGPTTLGEWELKRIHDHFRFTPANFITPDPVTNPSGGELGNANTRLWSGFSIFIVKNFQRYLSFARPRDAADAYKRALRNGVSSGNVTFDSGFGTDSVAASDGRTVVSRTISITTASKPWSGDYLVDLEPRYHKDVDGDGEVDIIDAWGRPIIYIDEGLPAAARITSRQVSLAWSPTQTYSSSGGTHAYLNALRYHPDPDKETAPAFFTATATSCYNWITDRPNGRGVPVRSDAADIAIIRQGFASSWIYALYGYDPYTCGDPYALAGTVVPSRIGTRDRPTNAQAGDPYYVLSRDGATFGEPFNDLDSDGVRSAGEPFIDRNHNGVYDDNVGSNDIRLVAPIGTERAFELWSAGRGGYFHAVRTNAANADNIGVKVVK